MASSTDKRTGHPEKFLFRRGVEELAESHYQSLGQLRLVIYSSASYPGFVIWRKLSPSDPSFSWVFAIEALAWTTARIAGFWYFISLPPFFEFPVRVTGLLVARSGSLCPG
jgi:hypothetical protein